ncbi:MAG: hypothetical protein M1840_002817 [Geoglossum simile]|nr:MAG: hypothetical protein M1840_002817 [Geoglossum simile]
MPRVKAKRSASPHSSPAKRIKEEETGSRYVPKPRASPIVIDGDSDVEMGDCTLTSAEREVAELDELIMETRRRNKIQHGNREAAEEALALKHSLEERAEQDEMKRLDELHAVATLRLRRYIRKSIVKSRTMPSRVNVSVPIKKEELLKPIGQDRKRGSETSPGPMPLVLTNGSTRATSLESPSHRSGITSARRPERGALRTVKKEQNSTQTEDDDDLEYFQNSVVDSDRDHLSIREINRPANPDHRLWGIDRNEPEDVMESGASEGDTDDSDREGATIIGADGRKRRLTKQEYAVPRIQMPEYILGLNSNYHKKLPLPETSVKFSRRFLTKFLGGGELGTYVNISQKRLQEGQVYPISNYSCFCPSYNPQVPPSAGRHGAGLSIGSSNKKPSVDSIRLQQRVSYFVKRRRTEWEYCGEYIQGRHFEKLRPDELKIHVKDETLKYWAKKIVTREWGTRALIKYGAARDESHAKTFTAEKVKRLFNKPDDAPGAKLRFYWQYMECCDYNLDLYEALSKKGLEIGWTTRSDLTKNNNFGVNAAMPTAVLRELNNESSEEASD